MPVDDELFDDGNYTDDDAGGTDETPQYSDEQMQQAVQEWADQQGYDVVPRNRAQQPVAAQPDFPVEMDEYQRETYQKIAQAQALANAEISAMVQEAIGYIRSRGSDLSGESVSQLQASLANLDLAVLRQYRAGQQHYVMALALLGSQLTGQNAPAGVRPQQGSNPIGSTSAGVNAGTPSIDSGQSVLSQAKTAEERSYMEHVKRDLMSRGRTAKEAEALMKEAL